MEEKSKSFGYLILKMKKFLFVLRVVILFSIWSFK